MLVVMKPKMLQRHLEQTSAKIGVDANRIDVAKPIIERYGHMDPCDLMYFENFSRPRKSGPGSKNEKIGAIILDDGMQPCRQHWGLLRDVEIVMLNGLMPCGNHHLLPRGPLREPFSTLARADIVVIHHADLAKYVYRICSVCTSGFHCSSSCGYRNFSNTYV